MSNLSILARPYAKAVFELAEVAGRFEDWQKILDTLAAIAELEEIGQLLKNPRVSTAEHAEVFIAAAGDVLDDKGMNFVRVLAQYRRLAALPAIASDYTTLRAAAENTVQAELRTAVEATGAQRDRIRAALVKKLGCKVELACVVDPEVLGGAVIKAGDLVIDDSVRGKLERLAANVAH